MKKLDLIGQKYNRLSVIEAVDPINGRSAWKCKCDCGTIKIVKTDNLRDGSTKSCGCLNDEQRSARASNMFAKRVKYAPQEASARRVWQKQYKEMPFEDFYAMCKENCFYCDATPNNLQNVAKEDKKSSQHKKDNGDFIYNGLDRKDSNLPHSKNNCVPCCKYCNYAKRERTTEEFKQWLIQAYNHLIK